MDIRSITEPYNAWAKPNAQVHESLFEGDDGGSMSADNISKTQYLETRYLDQNAGRAVHQGDLGNGVAVEHSMGPIHIKDTNANLRPVTTFESGKGLPYAPVDWPNHGDIWMWRVGRRINAAGHFQDRFLYPPKNIIRHGQAKYLASKAACESFIKSYYPEKDIGEFFDSFSWKIPSKSIERTKGDSAEEYAYIDVTNQESTPMSSRRRIVESKETPVTVVDEEDNEVVIDTSRSTLTKRRGRKRAARQSARGVTPIKAMSTTNKRQKHFSTASSIDATPQADKSGKQLTTPSAENQESRRRSSRFVDSSSKCQEDDNDDIPEDFDEFLDSMESMLGPSHLQLVPSGTSSAHLSSSAVEFDDARGKLSSLLTLDFPSLVSGKNVTQLKTLTSIIRNDPTLSAEKLVKLKLIDEIPLFSEVYEESLLENEEVDKFFVTVEDNKTKLTYMKKEYQELKEKAYELQTMNDFNRTAVQEMDRHMEEIKARRDDLTKRIDATKIAREEIVSAQKMVAIAIRPAFEEIKADNAKMPEMDQKKMNARRRVEEILEKFSCLQGFVV